MTDCEFDHIPFETYKEQLIYKMSSIEHYKIDTQHYDIQHSTPKKVTKPRQKKLADVPRPTRYSKIQGLTARLGTKRMEIQEAAMKKKMEQRKKIICPYLKSSTEKAGIFIKESIFNDVPTIRI